MVKRNIDKVYETSRAEALTARKHHKGVPYEPADPGSTSPRPRSIESANRLAFADFNASHVSNEAFTFNPYPPEPWPAYDISMRCSPRAPSRSHALTKDELESCYSHIEATSADAYRASGFGWHPKRKKREMREPDMRYLLVRTRSPDHSPDHTHPAPVKVAHADDLPLLGFLSFMLTYEDGLPVIYIYEIHLDEATRGCGLGKHLIKMVESIGQSVRVEKSMLTVFRSNEHARQWYERLGYEIDPHSPPDKKLRGGTIKQADYLILSKPLSRGP